MACPGDFFAKGHASPRKRRATLFRGRLSRQVPVARRSSTAAKEALSLGCELSRRTGSAPGQSRGPRNGSACTSPTGQTPSTGKGPRPRGRVGGAEGLERSERGVVGGPCRRGCSHGFNASRRERAQRAGAGDSGRARHRKHRGILRRGLRTRSVGSWPRRHVSDRLVHRIRDHATALNGPRLRPAARASLSDGCGPGTAQPQHSGGGQRVFGHRFLEPAMGAGQRETAGTTDQAQPRTTDHHRSHPCAGRLRSGAPSPCPP